VIVPIALYTMKSVRESVNGLLTAASFVIVGTILNRFNVNFFAQAGPNTRYFPSLMEILVTIGLVSLMILLYRLAVTYLPVFHEPGKSH
jgi:Ni/Fe-hydrogenase subunit HybB-like protein